MNDEEREIDLKLMFAYVFKQWRKIALVTLVFGLLGAGYKLIKVLPTYSSLLDTYNQNMEAYEASAKTVADQQEKTQDIIDQLTEYSRKSIKANIDPYSETQTTATISVMTSTGHDDFEALLSGTNHANQITQAITNYIIKELDYKKLTDDLKMDDQILKELFSVSPNYDTDAITIIVSGNSEELTTEIMNYILSQTNDHVITLNNQYGNFSIVLSTPSTSVVTDNNLIAPFSAQMYSTNAVMNDTLAKINTLKSLINTVASPVVAKPTPVKVMLVKSVIKFLLFGITFGLLGIVVLLAFIYMLSGKIYSENDIKIIYSIKILTVMPMKFEDKYNKRFDKMINKKIDSSYMFNEKVSLEKAGINIEQYRNNAKSILLVCGSTKQNIEDIKLKLESIIKNIDFYESTNLNGDANELKKLQNSDGIIILAERNVTEIDELSDIITTIKDWNKPILGSIIL